MSLDLSALSTTPRLLFDVVVKPVQGRRFQPTGFPDLGAATYRAGDTDCLLVESAQSMANRLEATIWDAGSNTLVPAANGLSYVQVNGKEGKFLTASILEAHRLNSVYVEKADKGAFHKSLAEACKYSDKDPVDRLAFVSAMFRHDVNSLLHGTFLESIGGRLRLPRALSAFIEAEGINVAASGGVKNDHIMPGKDDGKESGEAKGAKEGYGNVPFHREEYTATTITASFNLDLQQIRSYGLGDTATRLLTVLALFKIRTLVDGNLRLRTACDLEAVATTISARKPAGFQLPSQAELSAALTEAIAANAAALGAKEAITVVTFSK
jgi:CRISPR-associated protein Csb1